MSNKLDELIENEVNVDLEKRKFMNKFGKYAVVSVGMAALMTPNASASIKSGCTRKPRKSCGGGGGGDAKHHGAGGGGHHGNKIKIKKHSRRD